MRIVSAVPSSSSEATVTSAAFYPPKHRPLYGANILSRHHTAAAIAQFPNIANSRPRHVTGLLSSWKTIAAYLDRGVRTVQRWERTLGLPIHRMKGGQLAPVFAYEHEIDRWLQRASKGSAPASASICISRTHLDRQPQWLTRFYNDLQQNVSELELAVASSGCVRSKNVTESLLAIQKLVQTALAHDRVARIQGRVQTNDGANRHTNCKPLSDRRPLASH